VEKFPVMASYIGFSKMTGSRATAVPQSNLYELPENDMHIYNYSNNFQHQTASILRGDWKSGFFARGPWG